MGRKKYKPQRIGIRPEWVRQYITIPVCKITLCSLVIISIFTHCKNYAEEKARHESEKIMLEESINTEESIIAESKRAKAQMEQEEKAKQESLAQIEVERRRTNTLYEDKITKRVIDGKKYWRNNKTLVVGKVDRIYGLEVITNNNWSFMIDAVDGSVPEEVVNIGYAEYTKSLKAQKEREAKKLNKENADRIQSIIDKDIAELTKEVRAKLTTDYIRLGKELYRVWEIKGDQLYCTKKGQKKKKNNYIQITYSDMIECIDYVSYEVG